MKVKVKGSIYLRGQIYWIKYYAYGKVERESSHSTKITAATTLLNRRVGEVDAGTFTGTGYLRTTFEDLMELVKSDYEQKERKSADRLAYSILHLEKEFGKSKAVNITSKRIRKYITKRKSQKAENATINRELSALRRGFTLALEESPPMVREGPNIPKLPENNIRTGYMEHADYLKLREALPDYLKPVLVTAYHYGMRKEEILSLPYNYVHGNIIELEPGTTKTDKKPRIIDLGPNEEMRHVVMEQLRIRKEKYPSAHTFSFTKERK